MFIFGNTERHLKSSVQKLNSYRHATRVFESKILTEAIQAADNKTNNLNIISINQASFKSKYRMKER